MRKRFLSILTVLLAVCMLFACGSSSKSDINTGAESDTVVNSTSRKIIYTYRCNIYTDNLDESVKLIMDALAIYEDSYIEQSSKSASGSKDDSASYKLRVKTDDFNAFLDAIRATGEIRNESLTSEDVTKNYVDLEAQKAAKEAEMQRLLELYTLAETIDDLAEIAKYIAQVETELNNINSALANYDSLVELSTIYLNIYQSSVPSESFGTKLLNVLKNTGKAVATFFEYLLYVIIYVLPFAAMGTGVFFLVWFIRKKIRRAKHPEPVRAGTTANAASNDKSNTENTSGQK